LAIFGEKIGVVMITILQKTSSSLSQKTPIFLQNFSAKIFLKS
jgi:hypothetical protein